MTTARGIDRIHSRPKKKNSEFWLVPSIFVGITTLLILARQGTALEFLYPAMAVVVGIFFVVKYPVHFIGYSWWLFFLTSEIRRFADFFHGSFNSTSPIQIAPIAVAMLTFFPILQRTRFLGTREGMPFLFMFFGEVYAYIVGIATNGISPATFTFANWLYPLLIAVYMASRPELYEEYRRVLIKTFIVGTIVVGTYGVIQYAVMPPWDSMWLILSGLTSSMGSPVPFGSRMFGPLNSAPPFAAVMSAGLVLTVIPNVKWRFLASMLGVVCLALTFVRSSWGALAVSMLFLMGVLDARTKIRIIFGTLILAAVCVPILSTGDVSKQVGTRLSSVGDIGSDNSFQARQNFYKNFLGQALGNVSGAGMGGLGGSVRLSGDTGSSAALSVSFDSGFMELPYTLGWPGCILFVIGLVGSFWRALRLTMRLKRDRFIAAWFAIALGTLAEMIFINTLTGITGILYMTGIALPVMAYRYKAWQRKQFAAGSQA